MRTKNWKQALSMLLAVALMATLLVVPAAAAGEMVLDMATNSATVTASTTNDMGGGFTYKADSKDTVASDKKFTFSDNYAATNAIKLNGSSNASGNRRTVNFTTTAATTIKVWWYDSNSSGGSTMNLWSGTSTSKVDGTTTNETSNTAYHITTFADVAAADIRIGCATGKAYIYKIEAAPKATTSAFVTAVDIKGTPAGSETANTTPTVDIRDAATTVAMTAEVTGGTSGTVTNWTVTDAAGSDATSKGVTVTPGDDGKSAVVNVAANAIRGKYTISATSVDKQQNEAGDGEGDAGMTGSATLLVRRAVVDTIAFSDANTSAAANLKMGDDALELQVTTTWVANTEAEDGSIVQPASDQNKVTFESSNTDVVTVATGDVDNDGKGTLTIVGRGTATITATSGRNLIDGTPAKATLNVTVSQGEPSLTLSTPRNTEVASGGNYLLFKLEGLPATANDAYTYVSVDPSTDVTVSAPGEGDHPYSPDSADETGWNVKVALPANTGDAPVEYKVKASYPGTDDYAAADSNEVTVSVVAATTKIIRITGQVGSGNAVNFTSGDDLVLKVDAVARQGDSDLTDEALTFKWMHGEDEITADGSTITQSEGACAIDGHTGHTESTLTIKAADHNAVGEYTCVVTLDSDSTVTNTSSPITVTMDKKAGEELTDVDVDMTTRTLSGVADGWKYSVEGDVAEKYRAISGTNGGNFTIPSASELGLDGDGVKAVDGIWVMNPGDDDTEAVKKEIKLERATTPVLVPGDGTLTVTTSHKADYLTLYRVSTDDGANWTTPTVTATEGGANAVISGLANGTKYLVKVDYGKYILGTIVPAEGTPAEPAGDPTALKEAIQAAKNKVIGIWYADNAADVADSAKFVSVSDGTAYNAAIAKAEAVANAKDAEGHPTSTTTELNAAAVELATAVSNFEALEKKDGTKHSTAFVLNMNEVTKQEIANKTGGGTEVTGLGTKGFFTLVGNVKDATDSKKKACVEDGDALFDDGFYGYQRWNSQGKVETKKSDGNYKAIKITTTVAGATVKAWVRNPATDSSSKKDRDFGVLGGSPKSEMVGMGQTAVVTLTLGAAGTYYLGGITDTLHLYRMEVVQPGVDPNPSAYDITIADTDSKGTVTTQVDNEDVTEAYEGDTVKVVAVGAEGYVVDTIKVTKADNSEVSVSADKTFTMPAEAVTVTVTFKAGQATKYTVTVTGGTADKAEAVEGEKVTVTAGQPEAGKVFDKWTATGVTLSDATESTVEFNMPAANVTLTATYKDAPVEPTEYNITVTAGANGTASASATKAAEGTKITLTVTPAAGYEVDQITSDDVTVAADKTFTMPAKDVTISVTFKATSVTPGDKYAVTVAAAENGTVSVDKTEAAEGDTVTITAEPADGYEVDAIKVTKVDGSEVTVADDNTFVMPAEAVTVTVTFKATTVTPPTVDKTELTAAIEAAEAIDTTGVAVSEDGTDVPTSEKWIAKSVKDAFDKALADAQAVADKANATQAEVDEAKTALTEAADALKAAIENAANGTKPVTKDDLTAAIAAADKAAKAITVDTDAKNVKKGTKWVTAEVKEAYETAIAAAQAVADNADATADEVAQALADLNTATRTFEAAQQDGTKASRPTGGGGIPGGVGVDNNTNKKNETLSDGTKRVTETAKDGTVTVTDTKPDGTKSVTVTTPAGEVTTTVTLGRDVDNAQVSVPVDDKAESGMVAVIVKPDGTEEIIRDSVVVDGDMVFDLDESATVKIVNNAKHFVDIDGHWAKSDVDYVTARELFNGVDATHFAPDTTMTRGMMATVLFRLDGEVKSGKSVDFSDVVADDWFAAAVDWAAEAGVINGYTDGTFGPDSSITREELVVMVYRYAGAPAVNGKDLNGFTDADDVADWAAAAMTWAIQNGIIQGKGNDILDPKGNATRAEVSAVLQRYVRLSK